MFTCVAKNILGNQDVNHTSNEYAYRISVN
jgi:hypothetical protein